MALNNYIKSGDFKGEKHVPVIEAPAQVAAGEKVKIEVSVGKDIAHPNTTEHHIAWIKLYFIQKVHRNSPSRKEKYTSVVEKNSKSLYILGCLW
ncbi:MAG: Neelaredoxin [Veillonella sp.]|nr:Neelaredoxin [Veillonella sp.]